MGDDRVTAVPESEEWKSAREAGMDVEQLEYLQTLTPEERLLRHNHALRLVLRLREAGRKYYGFDPRSGPEAE
jgi:hypothetical protein